MSAEIQVAVDWLQLNPPDEPIALEQALMLGKAKGGQPGNKNAAKNKGDNVTFVSEPEPKRKRGNSRAYILARLDRDGHAELAAKVRAQQLDATTPDLLPAHRPKKVEEKRTNQENDVTLIRGNTNTYAFARLRKDRPDIHARVAKAQVEHRKQGAHHKNVKVKPGQTRAYLLRRLARDDPAATPRRRAPTMTTIQVAGRRVMVVKRALPPRRRRRRR